MGTVIAISYWGLSVVLNMTVAAAMGDLRNPDAFTLKRELALLRPALLYADHVTLLSVTAVLLLDKKDVGSIPSWERLSLALRVADHHGGWAFRSVKHDDVRASIGAFQALDRRDDATLTFTERRMLDYLKQQQAELSAEIEQYWDSRVVANWREIHDVSGLQEIELAIEAGLLTIDPLLIDDSGEATADAYVARLGETLGDGKSLPLIDEKLRDAVDQDLRVGRFRSSGLLASRSAQGLAGTEFIAGLPAFPNARLETLLPMREAVKDSLAAYQSEVAKLTKEVADQPFSLDQVVRIQDIYMRDVMPTLRDLEHQMQDKKFWPVLRTNAQAQMGMLAGSLIMAGGSIGIGIAQFTGHLPSIGDIDTSTISQAATVWSGSKLTGTAGSILGKSRNEVEDRSKLVERHGLFYLHQINAQLARPDSQSSGQ